MARDNPGKQFYEDPNLFAGGGIKVGSPNPVKRGFWVSLLMSQPLLMLGGMWMLLVLIATIAFGGLLDPGGKDPPRLTPMEQSRLFKAEQSASKASTSPAIQSSGGADAQLNSALSANETDDSVKLGESNPVAGPSIPVWSLAALALTCAAGCLVINHYLNAPPAPLVKNLRQPRHPQANRPTLRSLKRLKPYTPPEASSLPTPGAAQPFLNPPEPSSAAESPIPGAKSVTTTVVPPTEANPLDWPEGSLAHQLDLRQQKSLSSWL